MFKFLAWWFDLATGPVKFTAKDTIPNLKFLAAYFLLQLSICAVVLFFILVDFLLGMLL